VVLGIVAEHYCELSWVYGGDGRSMRSVECWNAGGVQNKEGVGSSRLADK
jgi:hypothetical protein